MTSVLTLLTPLAAKAGVGALITVRIIEGIFEVSFRLIDSVHHNAKINSHILYSLTTHQFAYLGCDVPGNTVSNLPS